MGVACVRPHRFGHRGADVSRFVGDPEFWAGVICGLLFGLALAAMLIGPKGK